MQGYSGAEDFTIQLEMASRNKQQFLSGHFIMNAETDILEGPCSYNIYICK